MSHRKYEHFIREYVKTVYYRYINTHLYKTETRFKRVSTVRNERNVHLQPTVDNRARITEPPLMNDGWLIFQHCTNLRVHTDKPIKLSVKCENREVQSFLYYTNRTYLWAVIPYKVIVTRNKQIGNYANLRFVTMSSISRHRPDFVTRQLQGYSLN